MIDDDEIRHRFEYHPPRSTARVRDHEFARNLMGEAAMSLARLLPEGREKSTCITKLEEAMFWANAALARAPDPDATASEEEAAAGPKPLRQVNLLPEGDDDQIEWEPHSFETMPGDPERCDRCGEYEGHRCHTDPREGLDPDEEVVEDGPPPCTVPIPRSPHTCAEPAFGYIIMGDGKRWPMCEYHWREDDSGHARERFR